MHLFDWSIDEQVKFSKDIDCVLEKLHKFLGQQLVGKEGSEFVFPLGESEYSFIRTAGGTLGVRGGMKLPSGVKLYGVNNLSMFSPKEIVGLVKLLYENKERIVEAYLAPPPAPVPAVHGWEEELEALKF